MTYRGRVQNGQILLIDPVRLPEGTELSINVVAREVAANGKVEQIRRRRARRIKLDPDLARQIAALGEFDPNES